MSRRAARLAWAALLLLVLLLALAAGGAGWLWRSEQGWQQLLPWLPGLKLEGARGRPGGGPFAIEHLQWQGSGWRITVDGLAWDDAQWQWRPGGGGWVGLALRQPRAARVQVQRLAAPPSAAATAAPTTLRLPLALQAPGLRIGRIELADQLPLTAIAGDLWLGAAQGREHQLRRLELHRAGLALGGDIVLGSDAPLPLQARLTLAPDGQTAPWQAELQASGPLQRLALQAGLQHGSGAQARVRATLAPFAAWPLPALQALSAELQALDLAALMPGWPGTRLSGRVELAQQAGAAPTLVLALDNGEPGRWSAGRLPLRTLALRLQDPAGAPDRLSFDGLQAELAAPEAAGRVQGSGGWQAGKLTLQLSLQEVQARLLDSRAPPLAVDGRLEAALDGLAAGELRLDLAGRAPRDRLPPLQLQAVARFRRPADGSLVLALEQARAQARPAGAAPQQASASATATRSAAGAWQLATQGTLQRFDPGLWWPAAARAPGQHIDGRWQAALGWSAGAAALAERVQGQATLTLDDSRWAGQALHGQAALQAGPAAWQADADLQAGRNRVRARLHWPRGTPAAPQGELDLQAPELQALAPLAVFAPAGAWPQAGSLQVQARFSGRWPALSSSGQMHARGLRSATTRLETADAQWALDTTHADAPLQLRLELAGLAAGERRLDHLEATLQGSLREHRLVLDAASPLRPPAWAEAAAGHALAGGSRLQLQARGGWAPQGRGAAGSWQGTLLKLQAAARSAAAAPWLEAGGVQASLVLDADGRPRQAALAPGRVQLFGGALDWQQARWQAPSRLALQARIEPLQVAPWLARWQPQFGWQGDLAVGGRIDVRSGERLDADVVLERSGGDLSLGIEGTTRALGLSTLRASLAAHGGQWQITQAVVGHSIGVIGGLQTLRTPAGALWPAADAPLSGGLSLQVPDFAVWAPWLPPGWRLGGQLRCTASFGGRFAAPEYRGRVDGENLAVHNLFEGIHLQQGRLAVALEGTQATVEGFEFHDATGSGRLRLTGGAGFGAAPRTRLQATAEKLRLLDRFDRRVTLSGQAGLDLQAGRTALRGSLVIDEGLIDATQSDAPASDADVQVLHRAPLHAAATAPAARPPGRASSPFGRGADVDLQVDLGQQLRLRGRGLDTLLRGRLHASTPDGRLAVQGEVDAEGGSYRAYGQNLRIERGGLHFSGDVASPQLDVLALRADIDTRVGVVVTGSVANPRVRLYSEPELGQLDTLTWLMLGRAPEGLGRDDTALLQRTALALLAGERDSGGFVQKLGLDELSLRRADGSSADGGLGGTVLSLGKQVSRRVFIGYEQALGATSGTLQLIYRLAGRLTLRARTGGDNALDAVWTWRWN